MTQPRSSPPWVRLSTSWYLDPKMLAVSETARLLYLQAIAWSGGAETDGVIARAALPVVRGPLSDAAAETSRTELLSVGLWTPAENGGVRITRYDAWQESAEDNHRRREADAERKARWRAAQRGDKPVDASRNGSENASRPPSRDARQDASGTGAETEAETESLPLSPTEAEGGAGGGAKGRRPAGSARASAAPPAAPAHHPSARLDPDGYLRDPNDQPATEEDVELARKRLRELKDELLRRRREGDR